MTYLSRDAILTADDFTFEDVEVPEWGGTVRLRTLAGSERDKFEASVYGDGKKAKLDDFRARLSAMVMVDENGDRLFSDSEVKQLAKKSAAALSRVFDAALRMNGISDGDVEELAGN